jgi:hypothetical protein
MGVGVHLPVCVQVDYHGHDGEELDLSVLVGHETFPKLPSFRTLLHSVQHMLDSVDILWVIGLVQCVNELGPWS